MNLNLSVVLTVAGALGDADFKLLSFIHTVFLHLPLLALVQFTVDWRKNEFCNIESTVFNVFVIEVSYTRKP